GGRPADVFAHLQPSVLRRPTRRIAGVIDWRSASQLACYEHRTGALERRRRGSSVTVDGTWDFWIDVGGTFTDCTARDPRGHRHRAKTLSSGATKGTVGQGSSLAAIVDRRRTADPDRFWEGYRIALVDSRGRPLDERRVVRFERTAGL